MYSHTKIGHIKPILMHQVTTILFFNFMNYQSQNRQIFLHHDSALDIYYNTKEPQQVKNSQLLFLNV